MALKEKRPAGKLLLLFDDSVEVPRAFFELLRGDLQTAVVLGGFIDEGNLPPSLRSPRQWESVRSKLHLSKGKFSWSVRVLSSLEILVRGFIAESQFVRYVVDFDRLAENLMEVSSGRG